MKYVVILIHMMLTGQVLATDFFVDPINGSTNGDGSENNPWKTIQEVLDSDLIETQDWQSKPPQVDVTPLITINAGAPIKSGDTIWLMNGFHGSIDISGAYNTETINIKAMPGHHPQISYIKLIAVQHWLFEGLQISPSFSNEIIDQSNIFEIRDFNFQGPSWDVTLTNNELFSIENTEQWGANEWINDTYSGISVRSDRISIINNKVTNVRFGITVNADHAIISHNTIDGFSADGIRGLGNNALYEYNLIQNCYVSSSQGDNNHDDGFQSWSFGTNGVGTGSVNNVILRGNRFINYTDPNNPLNSTMQGIGCFDGNFVNWTVENNVVATDHWHGISFYGMINSKIVNNTVLDLNESSPGPPWILLRPSNISSSENVIVRNNLSTQFTLEGNQITDDHNLQINNPDQIFVEAPQQLTLLADSNAIDAGTALQAPNIDLLKRPRPSGNGHDLGAYEYFEDVLFSNGFE